MVLIDAIVFILMSFCHLLLFLFICLIIFSKRKDNQAQAFPNDWEFVYQEQVYQKSWVFLLLVLVVFVNQLLKEGELDNFVVDALNWIGSDGLAIFVTTIFLPPIYLKLQEHDLLKTSQRVFAIFIAILFVVYLINYRANKIPLRCQILRTRLKL